MFGFLNWSQTRRLRYQSFQSHPEAKPRRPDSAAYVEPRGLQRTLQRLEKTDIEDRILKMLRGYFVDMFLCLKDSSQIVQAAWACRICGWQCAILWGSNSGGRVNS